MKANIRIIQLEDQFELYSFQDRTIKEHDTTINFGFDNFSEKQLVNYGLQLIEESEEVSIEVEMKENASLGVLPFFFRKAIVQKQKIDVKYRGKNENLYKLLLPFKPDMVGD